MRRVLRFSDLGVDVCVRAGWGVGVGFWFWVRFREAWVGRREEEWWVGMLTPAIEAVVVALAVLGRVETCCGRGKEGEVS